MERAKNAGPSVHARDAQPAPKQGERGLIALEWILSGWILSGPMYDCPTPISTEVNLADTHVLALTSAKRHEESALE